MSPASPVMDTEVLCETFIEWLDKLATHRGTKGLHVQDSPLKRTFGFRNPANGDWVQVGLTAVKGSMVHPRSDMEKVCQRLGFSWDEVWEMVKTPGGRTMLVNGQEG